MTIGRMAPALTTLLLVVGATGAPALQASQTITWGSSLRNAPTRTLSAGVDAAYWQQKLADGSQTVAPKAGRVTGITLWGRVVGGEARILFQNLRPGRAGKLRVISTTQPFKLSHGLAKSSFSPINFLVHKGDHVGLATIGGSYEVFAATRGSTTEGLVGAGRDMNGAQFTGTAHRGLELLLGMTERVGR